LSPNSFEETIGQAILLGGDVDTIACMAGALSGAHLGAAGIPTRLVELLENGPQGRDFLTRLAGQLCGQGPSDGTPTR